MRRVALEELLSSSLISITAVLKHAFINVASASTSETNWLRPRSRSFRCCVLEFLESLSLAHDDVRISHSSDQFIFEPLAPLAITPISTVSPLHRRSVSPR